MYRPEMSLHYKEEQAIRRLLNRASTRKAIPNLEDVERIRFGHGVVEVRVTLSGRLWSGDDFTPECEAAFSAMEALITRKIDLSAYQPGQPVVRVLMSREFEKRLRRQYTAEMRRIAAAREEMRFAAAQGAA